VEVSTAPLRDSEGRIRGAVATLIDVSSIKSMEERIRQLDRLAALGRFASSVAHELRNPLTGIATGDQGMFVERQLFDEVGGFPAIALMEDVALSATLRRHGRPLCLEQTIIASSRRWEEHGISRTITLMWRLRLAYSLGAEPARLAEIYYGRSQ